MKKTYINPETKVILVQTTCQILAGSATSILDEAANPENPVLSRDEEFPFSEELSF